MKYIVHLSQDTELALIELKEYLTLSELTYTLKNITERFLLLETTTPLRENTIQWLGNTLRIAEVLAESETPEEIEHELHDKKIYAGTSNLLSYHLLMSKPQQGEFYETYLKEYYKAITCKAMLKKEKKVPHTEELIRKGHPETYQEFLLLRNIFAVTRQVSNTIARKKREQAFPYKRTTPTHFAITLLNLAHVKPKQKILIPFADTGSICFEALDRNTKVFTKTKETRQLKSNRNFYTRETNNKAELYIVNDFNESCNDNSCDALIGDPFFTLPQERSKAKVDEKFRIIIYNYRTMLKETTPLLKPKARIILTLPIIQRAKERLQPSLKAILPKNCTLIQELKLPSENGVGRVIEIIQKL